MQVAKISGGISNLLVKVSPPASTGLQSVAVKVFGEKTELLIDREVERRVLLQLNKAGFGAKVGVLFALCLSKRSEHPPASGRERPPKEATDRPKISASEAEEFWNTWLGFSHFSHCR